MCLPSIQRVTRPPGPQALPLNSLNIICVLSMNITIIQMGGQSIRNVTLTLGKNSDPQIEGNSHFQKHNFFLKTIFFSLVLLSSKYMHAVVQKNHRPTRERVWRAQSPRGQKLCKNLRYSIPSFLGSKTTKSH